jgi:hypothetical protein
MAEFHEIWCEHYATGGHSNLYIVSNKSLRTDVRNCEVGTTLRAIDYYGAYGSLLTSSLKMEAAHSSETAVNIYQTTW